MQEFDPAKFNALSSRTNMYSSHEVTNQPDALENYNAYTSDAALQHWVNVFSGNWGAEKLTSYGDKVGGELIKAGFDANKYAPEFISHDRFGHRIDRIEYHPSYHQLMAYAKSQGYHSLPWTNRDKGAHVVRAAMEYLHPQADAGSACPLTMTFAAVATIKHQPKLADIWLPKILKNEYDPRDIPFFEKDSLTIGMAMTEKQGGSDVRANTTHAEPIGRVDDVDAYQLVGHKWFMSAPMCDAFLVLAQLPEGLSCFLMPRFKPDGTKNHFKIQRLKQKLGNRSNASSEVELYQAFAWIVGEPGKGVRTIIDMVALTRFDCIAGTAGMMAAASKQAIFHTSARQAFGKPLHEQPLMQNVLADLALESEAALAFTMRMAHALDNLDNHNEEKLLRIGTAIGKYWVCKRAPQHAYEAMECIGGVGLVEDNLISRMYRDAPVNAIWEGSGNVQCLDVLRAIKTEQNVLPVLFEELSLAGGSDLNFDKALNEVSHWQNIQNWQPYSLRIAIEKIAIVWQASILIRYGEKKTAKLFCQSRLCGQSQYMYGQLADPDASVHLIARAIPNL